MKGALLLLAVILCVAGCGNQRVPASDEAANEALMGGQGTPVPSATSTATPAPTDTPIPPTATAVPSPTAVPPTATNEPTATPAPTDTAVPPTATKEPTATVAVQTATVPADLSSCPYIGNKNSMKFHRASCGSVKQMKDSNKVCIQTREEAIAAGYVPCGNCKP